MEMRKCRFENSLPARQASQHLFIIHENCRILEWPTDFHSAKYNIYICVCISIVVNNKQDNKMSNWQSERNEHVRCEGSLFHRLTKCEFEQSPQMH